jgi:glycerophosphoryl diester phosphodiesterase
MEQKADFVEPDLAVTKDNVFICLHDDTLERTTNIAEVFPDRPSANVPGRARGNARRWLANDFTVAEIKRLDAGKWRDPKFTGERIVTFQEMIDLVRGHAGTGIYPELKSPQLYKSRNVDQVKLFVDLIKKNGLEKPESLKTMPVVIQSFDEEAIRRVAADLPTIPRVFLTSSDADLTDARLRELAAFATGIAPEKALIAKHPDMVARAHAVKLTVTSWTFSATEKTSFPTVRDEMSHYLYTLGIDALFTNNPDQFPRRP